MIVASVCTIPERKDDFKQVCHQILHAQVLPVNRLHVWLNGYRQIDSDLPREDRLIYHLEPSNPGPWIRYCAADRETDFRVLLTLDDDISYPADYVAKGCAYLDRHTEKESISFGGMRWDYSVPVQQLSYIDGRKFYGLVNEVLYERTVAIPLGALSFYRADHVRQVAEFPCNEFRTNDDMLVGWQLQRRGVSIICCPAAHGWVKNLASAEKDHALSIRDANTRYVAFRKLVDELSFDPTANAFSLVMEKQHRLLILSDMCPPLPGSESLNILLRDQCSDDTSVHLLAVVPASQMQVVQHFTNILYEIHAINIPEQGGQFDYFPPVRAWRNWRVQSARKTLWAQREALAFSRLKPTQVYQFQNGQLIPAKIKSSPGNNG